MRKAVIKVALFSCACIFLPATNAQAFSPEDFTLTSDPLQKYARLQEKEDENTKSEEQKKEPAEKKEVKAEPEVKQPLQHTVDPGETLTVIAQNHSTTWQRLFDKNLQIANPDILNIGAIITIPEADEQLASRPLPVVAPPVTTQVNSASAPARNVTASTPRGSSAGNTYAPGYCTWYAKSRRPDLPNRLGNASSWVASAAAQGFATGTAPRAGAIGQQGNHVVYVESVNGDGTVTVSEMNYRGLYVVSSRTVSASAFRYIY